MQMDNLGVFYHFLERLLRLEKRSIDAAEDVLFVNKTGPVTSMSILL